MKKSTLLLAAACCMFMLSLSFSACQPKEEPKQETAVDCIDPLLNWGADYAAVQAHVEAKKWYKNGNENLELWGGMGWHRWYWVSDSITEQYLFETEDGKNLWEVVCICYDSKISREEGKKYLSYRGYTFVKHKDATDSIMEYDAYLSKDKKTGAGVFQYTDSHTWLIDFFPYEGDWDEE